MNIIQIAKSNESLKNVQSLTNSMIWCIIIFFIYFAFTPQPVSPKNNFFSQTSRCVMLQQIE